jgi:hypothetical protein
MAHQPAGALPSGSAVGRARKQRSTSVILALVRSKRLRQPRLGTRKLHHLISSGA